MHRKLLGAGATSMVFENDRGHAVKYFLPQPSYDAVESCKIEAHYLKELGKQDIFTPNLIQANFDAGSFEHEGKMVQYACAIEMEKIEGREFHDVEILTDIPAFQNNPDYESLVDVLIQIQNAKPVPMAGQPMTLIGWLDEVYKHDEFRNKRQGFYDDIQARVNKMAEETELVFCHGDFGYRNLIFNPKTEKFDGIIDLTYGSYGFIECDMVFDDDNAINQIYEAKTGRIIDHKRKLMTILIGTMGEVVHTRNVMVSDDKFDDATLLAKRDRVDEKRKSLCKQLSIVGEF